MRLEIEVGLYSDDIATCLKWYSRAYGDKHPSKNDEKLFNKLNIFHDDLIRQDKENEELVD